MASTYLRHATRTQHVDINTLIYMCVCVCVSIHSAVVCVVNRVLCAGTRVLVPVRTLRTRVAKGGGGWYVRVRVSTPTERPTAGSTQPPTLVPRASAAASLVAVAP